MIPYNEEEEYKCHLLMNYVTYRTRGCWSKHFSSNQLAWAPKIVPEHDISRAKVFGFAEGPARITQTRTSSTWSRKSIGLWSSMYDVGCMMFDVRCLMYDVWCMIGDVRCLKSDVRCLMYGVWCTMFDIWCSMYDVGCLMFDVWCMMCDVWCMMFDV